MSNQLRVEVKNNKVIMPDTIPGIDFDNVIASNPTLPYTASQDCFVRLSCTSAGYSGYPHFLNNGDDLGSAFYCNTNGGVVMFFKKGTSVGIGTNCVSTVWGLKY